MKYILTPCQYCNRDFGIDEEEYNSENTFKVNCPYCKKENVKQGINLNKLREYL